MEQRDGSPRSCVERMCREFVILSAMNDVYPDQVSVSGTQPVEVDVGEFSPAWEWEETEMV